MTLVGRFVTAKMREEKLSGEPGTLVNNGLICKTDTNYVMRGEGPVVLFYQGDDGNKMQSGIQVIKDRVDEIMHCSPIKLRAEIRDVAEFCGCLITSKGLFPNILRRANKIIAFKARDYTHWCEYQKSLREFTKLVNELGLEYTVAATVENCSKHGKRMSYDEAYNAWEFVVAMSHINKEDWEQITSTRQQKFFVPRMTPHGEVHVSL
jgi:hypothetical protein